MACLSCSKWNVAFVALAALIATSGFTVSRAQAQSQPAAPTETVAMATPPAATMPPVASPSMTEEDRGDLAMYHGSYAAAIDSYQKARPRTAVLWNKIGTAFHHLHALDEATKYYRIALSLNPHYTEALNNLGAVYHARHDFAQAEKQYQLALKYGPEQAVTYSNLGTAYFAQHNYRKGSKAYQRALELDANVFNPKFHPVVEEGVSRETRVATAYSMAKVYAKMGRNEDALASLRTALSSGYRDRRHLLGDKEFASLRELPEFHSLLVQGHLIQEPAPVLSEN